jgi:acetyl esterase/lipase
MSSDSLFLTDPAPADQRLAYGADPLQFGDLRVPEGAGPFPLVIAIHGGYWRNAYDLVHLGHLCAALTAAGMATFNLEYRRVGDDGGGWPGTFQDVAAGARWIVDHAARYNLDPERVVVIGHSAGGHLASWVGSLSSVPDGSPITAEPVPLRGVVSLAGVLDLEEAWQRHLSNDAVVELLGGTLAEVPERYAAASPLALLPVTTPHVLLHGDADDLVPLVMAEVYHARATVTGSPCEVYLLPSMDHFDVIDPRSPAWPTVLTAVRTLLDTPQAG